MLKAMKDVARQAREARGSTRPGKAPVYCSSKSAPTISSTVGRRRFAVSEHDSLSRLGHVLMKRPAC